MKKILVKTILNHTFNIAVLFLLFALICFIFYNQYIRRQIEVEGIVKDKWISLSENQSGNYSSGYVLVETANGRYFTFKVDDLTFQQLQREMRVKHFSNGKLLQIK